MNTLNRNNTDLFLSQRTFTNESKSGGDGTGDWWRSIWAYGVLSANQYNALVDNYEQNELDASNDNLEGTAPDNSHFGIGGMPQRPRPVHK